MTCEPYANGQGWWHVIGCDHIDWEGDDQVRSPTVDAHASTAP